MKVIVIGGVAAGTKAAAKLKRQDRSVVVDIYTRSRDISYAGCGLPYYVGGDIETREELIVNSPEKFASLTGTSVHTGQEAIKVDINASIFLPLAKVWRYTIPFPILTALLQRIMKGRLLTISG